MPEPCSWCGGSTSPMEGIYLEMLYPGQSWCDGCGHRTLLCTCLTREEMARQLSRTLPVVDGIEYAWVPLP